MRRISSSSPLLLLGLVLLTPPVGAQAPEVDDKVVVADDDEVVVADDDEVVVADDDEVVVADDDEVVVADDDAVVVADDDAVVVADDGAVVVAAPAEAGAQAGGEVEAGLFPPGQEPWRAPAAGQAVIWGRLVDKDSGEPALEAQIKVVGTSVQVLTDFEGYYRVELPPGRYDLEVFYEMYEPTTLKGVSALQDQVARQDVPLTAQTGAVEEIVIQDQAESQTVAGLALKRQKAVASGDAVGREEISKTADRNAAQAAQRVVGASIVGDRFVYVRGLGERYTNALLGGFPLPSPEPDVAAVPLDVFPAAVLDSLTIVKVATADIPADFAGGSVQIETRSVPTKPLFQVSLRGGINTQSTFHDRLTQPASGTDWLGFDNGMRAMPSSVPTDYYAEPNATKPDGTSVEPQELVQVGKDMNSTMSPGTSGTPINHNFQVVGGDTINLPHGAKLGLLGAVNYTRNFQVFENMVLKTYEVAGADPRGFQERTDYLVNRGIDSVRASGYAKASYLPAPGHKITLSGLHSQLADSQVSLFQGYDSNTASTYTSSQMSWVERGLTYGMLSGEHQFKELKEAQLDWNLSLSNAYRDQPDRRDVVYTYNGRGPSWSYVDGSESGRHFWSSQAEKSYGGRVDWTQPLLEGKTDISAKFGGFVNVKNRDFQARRFAYSRNSRETDPYSCAGKDYQLNCPDPLFVNDNIDGLLALEEGSKEGDFYKAVLNVYATYALADIDFSDTVHLVVGPRVEWTEQTINPLQLSGAELEDESKAAALYSTDVLPSAALVYSATKSAKARFSYARTIARPQLRELAPFGFTDYWGGWEISGYPDLVLTKIDNLDTRFEFWFESADVVAFSVFYKHFTDPIETILKPTGSNPTITFRNADGADLIGLELELRKNLGFIGKALQPFSIITNMTLAQSRVQLGAGSEFATNQSRPLINQTPWIYNLALNYETAFGMNARAIYNIQGDTLVQVGTEGMPDAYLHSRNSLDLSVTQKFLEFWSIQAQVTNLFNDDFVVTQGKELLDNTITSQYRTGTTFWLTAAYQL